MLTYVFSILDYQKDVRSWQDYCRFGNYLHSFKKVTLFFWVEVFTMATKRKICLLRKRMRSITFRIMALHFFALYPWYPVSLYQLFDGCEVAIWAHTIYLSNLDELWNFRDQIKKDVNIWNVWKVWKQINNHSSQSRRHGGFGELSPQTELQVPQIEVRNIANQLSFVNF